VTQAQIELASSGRNSNLSVLQDRD